jgi:hypothetical protein
MVYNTKLLLHICVIHLFLVNYIRSLPDLRKYHTSWNNRRFRMSLLDRVRNHCDVSTTQKNTSVPNMLFLSMKTDSDQIGA